MEQPHCELFIKEVFRRAAADELNHAVWFLYYLFKQCHNFFNLFSVSFDILKVNRNVNEEGVDYMNILFAEDDESLGKLIFHLLQKEFYGWIG